MLQSIGIDKIKNTLTVSQVDIPTKSHEVHASNKI